VFKELRKDKKTPNALRTVINVINSFKNPVNINDLYYFLNLSETSTKAEIKKVLEYSNKAKLLRCVATYNHMSVVEPKQLSIIRDMIKNVNVNNEIETELRFGILRQSFNPKINRAKFINILNKVETYKFKKSIEDFVDVYSDNVRTRYVFSWDFGKYIFFDSIMKNRISKVDISMKDVIDLDVRVAMSSEVKVKQYNTEGESYRKYRMSYIEPNELFRLDFTAITEGMYIDRSFVMNKDSIETFQIEIEFLSSDIDVNKLFKFIIQMLNN